MRSGWIVLVVGLLAMAGCRGDNAAKGKASSADAPPKPAAPTPPGGEVPKERVAESIPEPKPEKKSLLPKTPAIKEEAFKVPEAAVEGWKPSKMPLAKLARSVDDAMARAAGIGAKTDVYADIPEGSGRVTLYSRIQDRNHYSVEYVHPKSRLSVNLLIGNGKRRAKRERGAWVPLQATGSVKPPSVSAWLDGFTTYAFASITEGYAAWTALATAFPKAGFKVSVQENRLSVRGQPRTFYRALVSNPTTQVEARFDGLRMLPVTIRVVRHLGPRESKVMWTTAYSFGHRFEAKTFFIPAGVPGVP